MDRLPGSQGPWTRATERFRWLEWTVLEEEQLNVLRERFGLAELYFDHHPVTFGIST